MSGVAVFAVAFLFPLGITIGFPAFPPGQILYELLAIPKTTSTIWGIPSINLVNGIINGFFWGIIAIAVYGLVHRASRGDALPPMPTAPHLPTPPPKPMRVDRHVTRMPPSIKVRKAPIRSEQDIETIEGIGPVLGARFRYSGVKTVNDLLRVGATRHGRHHLANEVGVTSKTLLKWVCRGDLLRIRGVGKQYSSLLESAGVNTVTDLSMRNPHFLFMRLRDINREKNLVRRTPPLKIIEKWVNTAKNLKPAVM